MAGSVLEQEIEKVIGDKPITPDLIRKVVDNIWTTYAFHIRDKTVIETHALMQAMKDR